MKYLILILFFVCLFLSCENEDNIRYRYAETGCSDKWGTLSGHSDEELALAVSNYLDEKNIDISGLKITFDSSFIMYCYACHCTTGRIVEILSAKEIKRFLQK